MAQEFITLDQLRDRLTERVGNNSTYWGPTEKRDAINEAICVWQALTGEWSNSEFVSVVSGQTFYQVPASLIGPQRIKWSSSTSFSRNSAVLLVGSSLPELDWSYDTWEAISGNPQLWALSGINEFAVYPQPTSGTFQIEAITEAPRLFSGSDFIDMEADLITPLLGYGHYYLALKEGGAEYQVVQGALKEFIEAAAIRNAEIYKLSFYWRSMGLPKDEGLRPPRGPAQNVGAR